MRNVSIVGVGLIGGSFASALRKAGFTGEISGISSERTLHTAIQSGLISRATTLEQAAQDADVIYLSQPIDHILQTLRVLGPLAASDCLITDAGSTKLLIQQTATEFVRSAAFQGGHPMAGKEQRGLENADPDLFRNRPYVLTPLSRPNPHNGEFRWWLAKIGAEIVEMTPQQHDATVALSSHLPQLVSTILAATLSTSEQNAVERIHGPGLRDMTRLALSAPELWASILETNRTEVLQALKLFQNELTASIYAIESGDIGPLFRKGAQFSRLIRKN